MALTIKDLKIGECYVACGFNHQDWCFIHENNGIHHINLSKEFYSDAGWQFYINANSIREATEEEKHWLTSCINAGKFIPKSDIIFPTKEKLKDGDYIKATNDYSGYYKEGIIYKYDKQAMKENKEWWKELKKGDFVVSLSDFDEDQRMNGTIHEVVKDFDNSILYKTIGVGVGHSSSQLYKDFRPATEQEIALYKAHGKPVHINTPFPEEKISKEPKSCRNLTLFPNEGCCKTTDKRLEAFLIKRCGFTDSKVPSSSATGIGWNNTSYWWLKDVDKSSKEIYQLSDLEKFLPLKAKEMTKEELLAEAKRRYPIGTRYYAIHGDGSRGREFIQEKECYIYESNGAWIIGSANIYSPECKKWAEIISLPETSGTGSSKEITVPIIDERYFGGIDPISSPKTKTIPLLKEKKMSINIPVKKERKLNLSNKSNVKS